MCSIESINPPDGPAGKMEGNIIMDQYTDCGAIDMRAELAQHGGKHWAGLTASGVRYDMCQIGDRGGVCYGGNTEWGDWRGDDLVLDECNADGDTIVISRSGGVAVNINNDTVQS